MPPLLYLFLICYYHFSPVIEASPLEGEGTRFAMENEFPFVVDISYSRVSKYVPEHTCGGALITRTHVLTAAHCFDELEHYSDLEVRVGSVDSKKGKIHQIQSWIDFMDWSPAERLNPDFYYDVGIITLKEGVNANILLATITRKKNDELYNKEATMAGWGRVENNETAQFMKAAKVRVLAPNFCPFDQAFLPSIKDLIPQLYFCSKGVLPARSRLGDSGSPLFIDKNEIIGITGNHWPDAEVQLSKYRTMHPTMHFYTNFILSVTNNIAEVAETRAAKRCAVQ